MMNDLMVLKIELKASRIAIKRPDVNPRIVLGPQIKPEDYKKAIQEEFSECEGFEDWMVDPLYKKFSDARVFHDDVDALARKISRMSSL